MRILIAGMVLLMAAAASPMAVAQLASVSPRETKPFPPFEHYGAFAVGREHLQRGRPKEALAEFERARKLGEGYRENIMLLQYAGIAKARSGQLREGLADLEKGKAVGPHPPMMRVARMEICLKLGDPEKAKQALDEVTKGARNPRLAALQANAIYLEAVGEHEAAERDRQDAMKIATEAEKAWMFRTLYLSYLDALEYDKAITAHDEIMRRDTAGAANMANEACWVRALAGKDLERARQYCDSAVAATRSVSQASARNTRGVLNLKEGRYEAALADFNAALAIRPNSAIDIYGRALAYAKLGRSVAEREMRRAAGLDPNVAETYARYGLTP